MNLLRLCCLLVALPGRLVLAGLNRLGGPAPGGRALPALERPVRWGVHAFVWTFAVITMLIATAPSTSSHGAAAVTPAARDRGTAYEQVIEVEHERTRRGAEPTFPPASEPVPYVPDIDEGLVEHEDDDDGESRFCRRRWWC